MNLRLFDDAVIERVGHLADAGEDVSIENLLAENLGSAALVFTLMWTPDIVIEIGALQVRTVRAGGTGPWTRVLQQRWQDGDGEFSISLGVFPIGTTLEVRVVAMAFEADVPHVRAFVSSDGTVTQVIPENPGSSESMTRATLWIKKGKYTV
ncbi:MAG TPA: hypothetical protein VK358_06670 [Longimicrobium sp.]|nr:hypothetical protein [Longimicrobium sp.]